MPGTAGGRVTGFVFLRVRAHRLLLTAALLAVLLTTAVLATLTAFSGAIGDAALRHSAQRTRAAAGHRAGRQGRRAAEERGGGRRGRTRRARGETFDGLPVTVRTLMRSGPYALPRVAAGAGRPVRAIPDLTHFAALDRGRRSGSPRAACPAPRSRDRPARVEVALPEAAARRPRAEARRPTHPHRPARRPGVRSGSPACTGPPTRTDPYWQSGRPRRARHPARSTSRRTGRCSPIPRCSPPARIERRRDVGAGWRPPTSVR